MSFNFTLILMVTAAVSACASASAMLPLPDLNKFANHSFRAEMEKERAAIQHDPTTCNLSAALLAEIRGYQSTVNRILQAATQGAWRDRTYNNLATLTDKYGTRMTGSQSLEDAIDHVMGQMKADGLEVHAEEALVPHWVRGEEMAELTHPRKKKLAILGLGSSVGTPVEGMSAAALVVNSFEELTEKAELAKGRIVVFNQPYLNYGQSGAYRRTGAAAAAKAGAVAALVRSVAPESLDTPHTGIQDYEDGVDQIPVACITVEDAELLQRIQESGKNGNIRPEELPSDEWECTRLLTFDKGERITIYLKMLDYNLPWTTSRNAIGELKGTMHPDEVVILSGHIDSWDVGQGAMDDGGGCAISWEALALLKSLDLIPKRTLRAIMWTAEEQGLWGAEDYVRHHRTEADKIVAAFESDGGTFTPQGLDFAGSEDAGCIVYEILKLFSSIGATDYAMYESVSTDISHFIALGVPGLSLKNAADTYFWYHHTEADTMSMMEPDALDKGTGLWAAAAYIIADLTDPLPRRSVLNKV